MTDKNLRYILFFNTAAILRNVLGLIRAKLTSLWFGVAGVGELGQIITFFNFQTNISDLGTYPLLINRIGKIDANRQRSDYAQVITLVFIILFLGNSLFLSSILIFRSQLSEIIFNSKRYIDVIVLLAFINPLFTLAYLPETLVRAHRNFRKLAFGQNLTSLIGISSLPPVLYLFGVKGIIYNVYIFLSFNFLFFSFYAWPYVKDVSFKTALIQKSVLKSVVKFCSIYSLRKFLAFFSLVIFRIIIVQLIGIDSNGLFQSAWSISSYINVLFVSFMVYLFPTLSNIPGGKEFNTELNRHLEYLVYLIFPFMLILMIFPELFIQILFNKSFIGMSSSLKVLVILKSWEGFYTLMIIGFLAQSRLRFFLLAELIRSLALVVTAFFAIKMFQLDGAVVAILVMDILSVVTLFYFINSDRMFRLSSSNIKLLFATSLCLLPVLIPAQGSVALRILQIAFSLVLSFIFFELKNYFKLFKLMVK